jgi:hypothetical protein
VTRAPISTELRRRGERERRWYRELDVTEQMTMLTEARPGDDLLADVAETAIGEIETLRAIFGAVERGARPFRSFWDALRERDRAAQRRRL